VTAAIRVGTRRSLLARTQTDWVLARLARVAPDRRFEAIAIDTSGDRDRSLGGSPDFTDAIDRALQRGELDLAVHSAKDLPVELDPGLELAACPRRTDPRDCLVIGAPSPPATLPRGARVGSSSLRRRAQLLRWRPDVTVIEVRGNVDTRIGLVRSGRLDAVILAIAGISRLGRAAEITRALPRNRFLPAPAQGALAVVGRAGDAALTAVARPIDHRGTHLSVVAERALAAALGGDCNVPLGVLAAVKGPTITLRAEVLSPDGRRTLRRQARGPSRAAAQLGSTLGKELLERGALELLATSRR
jgi:hydroxymethylbilane synthase